ncbi:diacylglycerol/lipid kinase family protein [Algoriphagus chordae]|uniref:Diacylglycerol kinase family enzyme n=1 Tax=Algoriphagus chordae TaxID=237019 RepID=A0A2W7RBC7_9BACT|nr:diacylglycerol kinase family protein [Algoriphagus chordae]PZX51449.1 diacylglycerol kinase family enzyme [Algoriphagus chordae]
MTKKCLLILNPISGDNGITGAELKEMAEVHLSNYEISLWETTGKDDDEKILQQFEELKPELVLIGGGDGTIKLVSKSLHGKDVPLGVLPLGSANGLAKCLGINDIVDTWESIRQEQAHAVDAIHINGELCLHLADFGMNANLIKKFEQEEKRGMIGYVKHSLKEIFGAEVKKYRLTIDEESIEVEAKMIVIANGDQYGTGALINCGGLINDGKFEVIALNPQTADDYIRSSIRLFRGDLHRDEVCTAWRMKSCEIVNIENAEFQIDGEMIGKPAAIEAKIEKHAFRFYTGKDFLTHHISSE